MYKVFRINLATATNTECIERFPQFTVKEIGENGQVHLQGVMIYPGTAPSLRQHIKRHNPSCRGNGNISVKDGDIDFVRYLCKGPDKKNPSCPLVIQNDLDVNVNEEFRLYWEENARLKSSSKPKNMVEKILSLGVFSTLEEYSIVTVTPIVIDYYIENGLVMNQNVVVNIIQTILLQKNSSFRQDFIRSTNKKLSQLII